MEYPVYKADARALVGILIGKLDVNLPEAALEGSYISLVPTPLRDVEYAHSLQDP